MPSSARSFADAKKSLCFDHDQALVTGTLKVSHEINRKTVLAREIMTEALGDVRHMAAWL